jgi:heptaprenyl diphosphate synthase
MQVVADKTGSLISASARFGAMVSGAPTDVKETLTIFGEKIGIAFQLADDIIDIASESHESGKTPGTDLREGIPTLVTLNVMNSSNPADRELITLLKAPIKDEAVVSEVLKTLRNHDALGQSREQLMDIARDARAALGPLPVNDVTGALFSLCDAIIDRSA